MLSYSPGRHYGVDFRAPHMGWLTTGYSFTTREQALRWVQEERATKHRHHYSYRIAEAQVEVTYEELT